MTGVGAPEVVQVGLMEERSPIQEIEYNAKPKEYNGRRDTEL